MVDHVRTTTGTGFRFSFDEKRTSNEMGGPVTSAIRAMRGGALEGAINRMLGTPAPNPLAALSIGGLYSLFRAHDAVHDRFIHEANTPRAMSDEACGRMIEDLSSSHGFALEAVIAEIEAREPASSWERSMRLKLLVCWYADREDWPAVRDLLATAIPAEA